MLSTQLNESFIDILSANSIFKGIERSVIGKITAYAGAHIEIFEKNEYIMRAGDFPSEFGIVLSGGVTAVGYGADGRESIYAVLRTGDHFADILVASENKESPVSLFSERHNTKIIMIPFRGITKPNREIFEYQSLIIRNFFNVISMKYWELMKKIDYMSVFPIKRRTALYLSDESEKESNKCEDGYFAVKFDREGMASYLNADRSALSRVLSEMKKEGLISFKKNKFKIENKKGLDVISGKINI